jgi:hypothetical protein
MLAVTYFKQLDWPLMADLSHSEARRSDGLNGRSGGKSGRSKKIPADLRAGS